MDGGNQAYRDRKDRHQGTSAAEAGGNKVLDVLMWQRSLDLLTETMGTDGEQISSIQLLTVCPGSPSSPLSPGGPSCP